MTTLPTGYTAHDGGECPFPDDTYCDCIIRTAQGLGHSGVARADNHEWRSKKHAKGIGAVLGFRVFVGAIGNADAGIDPTARWPESELA